MKKKKSKKAGRRAFLKGTLEALVVAPVAAVAVRSVREAKEEAGEPFPGEPGYRDPGAYGSEAEDLAE